MTDVTPETKVQKKQVGRSPAYPFIGIEKAIERAQQLFDAESRYEAPLVSAYASWGLGAKSSGARQTAAALGYYGLIDVAGDGNQRKAKVSDLAYRILGDKREDQSERKALIREAALNPPIINHLYGQYPGGLPSDANVTHHLVFDRGFNEKAAIDVVSLFKSISAYIDLYQPQSNIDKPTDKPHNEVTEIEPAAVSVGDKIQWTSAGTDMFAEPATVLGFSEDKQWVFVDAGDAAAPIREIAIVEQVASLQPDVTPPPPPAHVVAAWAAANAARRQHDLAEDQVILSQGKLKTGAFEVRVTGESGAREIGKIIQLLEAQKLILSDDD